MGQNLLDNAGILDTGDDSHCPAAGREISMSIPKTGSEHQVYGRLQPLTHPH
jgi:hypothetical protein